MATARRRSASNRFNADGPSGLAVDDWVYITADPVSGIRQVDKCDPLDAGKMPAVGVIIQVVTATRFVVQASGEAPVTGVASQGVYFVGLNAKATATPPEPGSGQISRWQAVGIGMEPGVLKLSSTAHMVKRRG
jgi:hypothetical protein